MIRNEELIMKKGMDCLSRSLGIIEVEMFISTLMKSAYDYTKWRQEYFETAYESADRSQLENYLSSAAENDPHGVSYGLEV